MPRLACLAFSRSSLTFHPLPFLIFLLFFRRAPHKSFVQGKHLQLADLACITDIPHQMAWSNLAYGKARLETGWAAPGIAHPLLSFLSGHAASEEAPANPSKLSCHACVCLPTLSEATCMRRCAAYWCVGTMVCRWPIQAGDDQLIARDSNKHHGIDWHTILHARSFGRKISFSVCDRGVGSRQRTLSLPLPHTLS